MTPEQQQSQDELQAAVTKYMELFSSPDNPPMMATDWVLVVGMTGFDGDGDRVTAYNLAFSDGQMDNHRSIGLFRVAEDLILHGKRVE